MKNVVCMKWGTRYGAEYVNRLHSMVRRHVTGDLRVVCLTDDRSGIDARVECFDCPDIPVKLNRSVGWRKIALWQPNLDGLEGEALFLDLDVVIVDNIDGLFEYGAPIVAMRNWTQPRMRVANTSVFRFEVGGGTAIWDRFLEDPAGIIGRYPNEQMFVSAQAGHLEFYPDPWCRLFKVHCLPHPALRWFVEPKLPAGTKIVAFPGEPNPPDAARGVWDVPWRKRLYKHVRPTRWIDEHWR